MNKSGKQRPVEDVKTAVESREVRAEQIAVTIITSEAEKQMLILEDMVIRH